MWLVSCRFCQLIGTAGMPHYDSLHVWYICSATANRDLTTFNMANFQINQRCIPTSTIIRSILWSGILSISLQSNWLLPVTKYTAPQLEFKSANKLANLTWYQTAKINASNIFWLYCVSEIISVHIWR